MVVLLGVNVYFLCTLGYSVGISFYEFLLLYTSKNKK